MRPILYTLIALLSLSTLVSCGEDRSGEYYALVEEDHWIEQTMKEHYLWYDKMPVPKETDYFAQPAEFLKKILFAGGDGIKADKYSYVEMKDTAAAARSFLQRSSTYGFDFELIADPLGGTTHIFARVLFVLPNSPASEAGLQRGDWISAVGKNQITKENYGYLMSGGATTFARESIIASGDDFVWTAVDSLAISAARPVEMNPFYINKVYQADGKKIAYMMYNEFATSARNEAGDTEYATLMKQIFATFKTENPDAFILDLRYNPGGYLTCAQELAGLLAPTTALGKNFCTLEYNAITTPQTTAYNFDPALAAQNLDLKKIVVLTTGFTASASEAVINCLIPYMGKENVVVMGETTEGKNVAMQPYTEDRFNFIIWPIVAYVLNSEGNANYADGIVPTYQLNERGLISPLLPLGNPDELFLRNAISYITTGTVPDAVTATAASQSPRVLYNSMNRRKMAGVILP